MENISNELWPSIILNQGRAANNPFLKSLHHAEKTSILSL